MKTAKKARRRPAKKVDIDEVVLIVGYQMHALLRKCARSSQALDAWDAIRAIPGDEWGENAHSAVRCAFDFLKIPYTKSKRFP